MRRAILLSLPLCIAAVAGIMALRSQSLPRLGFLATMRIETYLPATGKLHSVRTGLHAQRSDGADSRSFEPDYMMEFIDPTTRSVTLLDFLTKTYTTQPLGAYAVARRKAPPPASCKAALHVPSCSDGPVVLGYVTKEVKIAPNGAQTEIRMLVSPQLGWFPLVTESHRDTGTLVQRTVVTSIQIGEPSAELFSIPPGFQELDAAAHMERGIHARGESVSPKMLEDVARRDREKRAYIAASYGLIGQLKLGWLRLLAAFAG
ncbi:MAG: hypothetical protein JNK87_10875 [Bryobacterales bacterium]|nr:hypothetical protein [Bryobacterales bacterium]